MGPLQKVTLCRIAKKLSTDACPDYLLDYRDQLWIGEAFLHTVWDEFVLFIQALEADSCKDIEVLPDATAEFLEVVVTCSTYKSRQKKRLEWLSQIFPLLMEDLVEEIDSKIYDRKELQNRDSLIGHSSNLVRTYMTTQIFDKLYECHLDQRKSTQPITHRSLQLPSRFIPTLCRFQSITVNWLLERERKPAILPSLYERHKAKDGIHYVYKHRWCYELLDQPPLDNAIELPPGGILAEEMGLGKTVEILALILLNERPQVQIPSLVFSNNENGDDSSLTGEEDGSPSNKRRKLQNRLLCICGKMDPKNLLKCTKCQTEQHRKCVKKNERTETYDPYLCPECWESVCNVELVQTKATLIVTPNIIKTQWISEINRHVNPNFNIFVYNGINSHRWISPLHLSVFDIVITDYSVLRKEFHYSGLNRSDRVTRNEAKKINVKSPLLMVDWWRICLDEAQMVESNLATTATLARMIPGVNRWAVTGTPIQQSMEDLLPLFRFIGIPEFVEPNEAWTNLVHDFVMNHENPGKDLPLISSVLSKCMWRTCKSKVEVELGLPPQTMRVHHIDLSLIEKIYYEDLHNECRQTFDESVALHIPWMSEEFDSKTISPKIMKLILLPLLRLRQCCTISVIQSGSSVPLKQFLQPKQLQAHLRSTNELDCKSALRTICSSFNAIAGLHILCDKFDDSVSNYQSVLELSEKYKDYSITVDSLLQIHALHNMILADAQREQQFSPDVLNAHKSKLNAMQWRYLEPYVQKLNAAKSSYEMLRNQAEEFESKIKGDLFATLDEILHTVNSFDSEVQQSIYNRSVTETQKQYFSQELPENLFNFSNLINHLMGWAGEMNTARTKLIKSFDNLRFFTMNLRIRSEIESPIWEQMTWFIKDVYYCHLSDTREKGGEKSGDGSHRKRKQKSPRKKQQCQLCQIKKELIKYECLLYDKIYDQQTQQAEGVENASVDLCLLKGLLTGLKTRLAHACPPVIRELEKHIKLMEFIQQMCKKLYKLWIEIEYTVKAYDELDMCKMRISITEEEDDANSFRIQRNFLNKEFDTHYFNLREAQKEFGIKFARLKYIINSDHSREEMCCPICTANDCLEFAVLECGHYICVGCYKRSCQFLTNDHISCSVCRHKQKKTHIHLLTRKKINDDINTSEYSAKIAYIIQLIWDLVKQENPKILIFSEWQPILKAIAKALQANEISFCVHKTPEDIVQFKKPQSKITCLLMQYQKGSKGINLTEATHVFLVEPILNPAEELQAVGRVHRIGQTKPTTVHRFIVNKTIEENIFKMVFQGTTDTKWDFENITVSQMKSLFNLDVDRD